jgi:ketosteroid isomerase-like protein
MNDVGQLVRDANPIQGDPLLLAHDEFEALLLLAQTRSGSMNLQELTKPAEPEKKHRSGWLIAAASFAVVILFVGVVMLLANTAENLPPVTEPVAESTPVAPIDVAEAWFASYEAGDVAGYQALMSADATFSCADCAGGGMPEGPYFDYPLRALTDEDAADSRTLYAGHGSLNATCAADGNVVTCNTERASLFGWFDEEGEPRTHQRVARVFTVEDGVITEYTFAEVFAEVPGGHGSWFNYGKIAAYGRWLSQNHPKDHAELFFGTTILVNDAEQVERHHMFVADWAAAATS